MQLLRILALASLAVMASEISTVAALGFDDINDEATPVEDRAAADAAFLLPVSGPAVAPNPPVPEYLAPGAPTTIGGAPDPSAAPAASSAPPAAGASKKPAASSAAPAAASAKPSVTPAARKATPTPQTKKRSMDADEDAVESSPAVERSMDDELTEAADADDN